MSGQPDNDCNCSYQLIHCKSPWSFVSKLPPKRVVECHPPSLRPLSGLRYAGSSLWRPASPSEVVVYSIMLNFIEYGQSIHRDRFSRLVLCELHKKGPPTRATELSATPVRDEAEIEAAASAFAREPGGGLIVAPDPFINTRRALVIALAERDRLPVIYGVQYFVREGGLISYGPDTLDIVRRSASYVDRVLMGERPGELPVQAPNKYELLINLKTAKALGLTVPVLLRVRADELIG